MFHQGCTNYVLTKSSNDRRKCRFWRFSSVHRSSPYRRKASQLDLSSHAAKQKAGTDGSRSKDQPDIVRYFWTKPLILTNFQ
jgi:lipopolysaccharide biosynthesis protein